MKKKKRFIAQILILCSLFVILFAYAMFQGGFVSWFLFYSFLPFSFYSFAIALYPWRRVTVRRIVSRRQYHAGEQLTVTIEVQLPIWFPFFAIMIGEEDILALNMRPSKRIIPFIWKKKFSYTYELEHLPRGEHTFTSIYLTASDFLGLMKKTSFYAIKDTIVVYPRYIAMTYRQVRELFEQGTAASSLQLHRDQTMAVGVREYVPGDRFSWVHWKASARKQQLMTKEFEEQRSDDFLVVLDRTPTPLFEELVTFTASLLRAAIHAGVRTGLVSVGHDRYVFPPRNSEEHLQQLFSHLARVNCDSREPFARVIANEKRSWTASATLCYVTSSLQEENVFLLREMAMRRRGMLFLLKEEMKKEDHRFVDMLRQSGISVSILSPHTMRATLQGRGE
ncbi:DUF58 domain-containing protein [Saccharococcus thermophilus]